MLCSQCDAIFKKPYFSRFGTILSMNYLKNAKSDHTIHHANFASLEAALAAKCRLCVRIWRKYGTRPSSNIDKDGSLSPDVDRNTFTMSWRMNFENGSKTIIGFSSLINARKKGKPWTTHAPIYLFWAEEQHGLKEPELFPPENSDDDLIVSLVSNWITDCQNHHSKCCAPITLDRTYSSFARILDIGKDPSSPTIRLRDADEVPAGAPYLTLSHCWGGADIPALKRETYSQYLESILIQNLPQTFADAVSLTRKLQFQYLWIDSMCIIQDSPDDWLDQSSKMDEVYRGSSCNIAASLSSTPYGGIFSTRDPSLIAPLRIPIKGLASDDSDTWYDVDDDFADEWTRQIFRAPVCNRGWVMQERLLAPRVVHFAKSQLFWECVERRTREGDTWVGILQPNARNNPVDFKSWNLFADNVIQLHSPGTPGINCIRSAMKAMYDTKSMSFTKKQLEDEAQALSKGQESTFREFVWTKSHPLLIEWARTILSYSSLSISREDDRLVAIAGLAKLLHKRTGIRYVAGHWLHQLPRQLLWCPPVQSIRAKQPFQSYIAPSWSWASCNLNAIWYLTLEPSLESKGVVDLVQVRDVQIEGARGEEKPMDKLLSGRLCIRGRLLPIELDLSKWPDPCERERGLVQYVVPSISEPPVRATFLVPVLFHRWYKQLPKATPNSILLEATDVQGTYRRIGTARLSTLYPLMWVVPDLYRAEASLYEDSDDDAASEDDEVSANKLSTGASYSIKQQESAAGANPREELKNKMAKSFQSTGVSSMMQILGSQIRAKASDPSSSAKFDKFSTFQRGIANALPGRPSPNPGFALTKEMKENIQKESRELFAAQGIDVNVEVRARDGPRVHGQTIKIAPKDAIEPQFYLEYVEDSESPLFGHFIFNII